MYSGYFDNAVMGKALAMYGKRLMPQDYYSLAESRSVGEIAQYLKSKTAYAPYLSGIPDDVHRGELERALHSAALQISTRLLPYMAGKNSELSHFMVAKREILLIMQAIRTLGLEPSAEFPFPYRTHYPGEHTFIDLEALARADSFDAVLEAVRKTRYHAVLLPFRPSGGDAPDVMGCENALIVFYYNRLFLLIGKHYTGETRARLLEIFRIQADCLNLEIIYRFNLYRYGDRETIQNNILPFRTSLKREQLEELIGQPDANEMIRTLHKGDNAFAGQYFHEIEAYTRKRKNLTYKKQLHSSTDAPVILVSYILLLYAELDNLVTVIEGVRYGAKPEEIMRLLNI